MTEKDKRFVALWQNLRKSRLQFSLKQGFVIAFIFILIATPINYFLTQPDDWKVFIAKSSFIWLGASLLLSVYYYFVGFRRYENRYNQILNQDNKKQ